MYYILTFISGAIFGAWIFSKLLGLGMTSLMKDHSYFKDAVTKVVKERN